MSEWRITMRNGSVLSAGTEDEALHVASLYGLGSDAIKRRDPAPLTVGEVRETMERFLREHGWEQSHAAKGMWMHRDVPRMRILTDAVDLSLRLAEGWERPRVERQRLRGLRAEEGKP